MSMPLLLFVIIMIIEVICNTGSKLVIIIVKHPFWKKKPNRPGARKTAGGQTSAHQLAESG